MFSKSKFFPKKKKKRYKNKINIQLDIYLNCKFSRFWSGWINFVLYPTIAYKNQFVNYFSHKIKSKDHVHLCLNSLHDYAIKTKTKTFYKEQQNEMNMVNVCMRCFQRRIMFYSACYQSRFAIDSIGTKYQHRIKLAYRRYFE